MLRLCLTTATTNSSRLSSTARQSSCKLLEARYFSSKPSDNSPAFRDDLLDKDKKNEGEKDALREFFEKRRQALQKEKRQQNQRSRGGERNATNNNNNYNQRQNRNNNNTQQKDSKSGGDALQSFFDKRRAILEKDTRGRDRGQAQNSNYNNNANNTNNHRRQNTDGWKHFRNNSPKGGEGNYEQGYRSQQHARNGRSNQNRNQRYQNHQNRQRPQRQDNDSSRLADLMKQLRRDPPVKPTSTESDQNQQPFWRKGMQRQQENQERRDGERKWNNNNNNNRSFLNRNATKNQRPTNNYRGGGGGGPQRNQRRDSEFLEGRLTRLEDDNVESGQHAGSSDDALIVTIPNNELTLSEVSALFRVKIDDIKRKLRSMGERVKNESEFVLDVDLMELLAIEYGIETVRSEYGTKTIDCEELLINQRRANDESMALPPRPPVVCIMGHVDHGKTTLMDALRRRSMKESSKSKGAKTKKKKNKKGKGKAAPTTKDVAGTEAGGITQIISAFQVAMEGQDMPVTFLDTPGHAAFRSMRQSGSHAADVIVLVIAADDGVSEQTIEILDFYKSIVQGSDGGISLVVALNKIDKPGIDVDEAKMRIENQLLEHGIVAEGMGSSDSAYGSPVQVIPTSGLTGLGLDDLMEGLLLQSEVMDLRADEDAPAEGIIMDAAMEKGLGVVATAIIRCGNIKRGDIVVSGDQIGKVKILKCVQNKALKCGMPSQPVTIVGFKELPKAGDPITCVESEERAEEIVERRAGLEKNSNRSDAPRDVEIHIPGMRSRDTARAQRVHAKANIEECDGYIRIPVVVKADADGSLSAIRESLVKLGEDSTEKVMIDPILEGIGEITPTDIQMAKESNAVIFSFGGSRVDQTIINLAESENVEIRSNSIIYSLLDEAKQCLGTYLPKSAVEHVHGKAMVQAIFNVDTDDGEEKIAGLKVTDGHIYKEKATVNSVELGCNFRVLRDGKLISPEGEVVAASSLRHYKELVDSVRLGDECGVGLSGFTDFQEGDTIECYSIEMKSISL